MFQCKIDEIFKELPNLFGIADDILIVGYDADGKDYDRLLKKCCGVNLGVKDFFLWWNNIKM